MVELGAPLKYTPESEYLDGSFRDILKDMCQNEGCYFESDSMADFTAGNLIVTSRAKFLTWTEEPDDVGAYYEDIVHWVEQTIGKSSTEEVAYDQLEQWLTVKCCKINEHNIYIMPPCHPAVRLVDQKNQRICDKFNSTIGCSGIERKIKWSVLQNNLRNNENFYVYGTGQVYFSKRKDGCRQAIPWKDVGTLTPLSSMRLIEKTKSWIMRNYNGEQENPEVRIAYIGTLTDEGVLPAYFMKNPIPVNKRLVRPQITFTQLKKIAQSEKYLFERTDNVVGSKRIYNLASLTDMRELFRNFQIVLFLDESYFYRQRQSSKNLMEKNAADYVQWCLKELHRRLQLEDSDEEKESMKYYFYDQIYNRTGIWLNGHGKSNTSKLGFDCSLFDTIVQAFDPKCDVYLYISRGKTIGDIRLPIQSICNDERYDGRKMLVYRVTAKESEADNEKVCDSVRGMLNDSSELASIDLWKLVKSIGSEFRGQLFDDLSTDESVIAEQVHVLKNVFLNVTVNETDNGRPKLQFCIYRQGPAKGDDDRLKEFVQTYLKICNDETDFPYVKDYLYELLSAAMVSRAKSDKGIFYAYLMRRRRFVDIDTTVSEKIDEPSSMDTNGKYFRARRAIYSAIQGLDQIIVRDMNSRLSTLKYEFRYKYCPDIKEDTLLVLLDRINKYCVQAGYTDGRLYLLTKNGMKES